VKSSGENISEQSFGMTVGGSDCGECLVMFMNILAGTENAKRSIVQSTCALCVIAKFNKIL
jgi:hypothetical protein